jgi:LDH2 family malate/lactate/ureidoglycolate dehydrogenase
MQAFGGAKGFGLAILVDLLAGILPDSGSSVDVKQGNFEVGAMVLAIDPAAFGSTAEAVSAQFTTAARAVRDSGGRWPGDRGRAAKYGALEEGVILVPRPIFELARDEVGEALTAAIKT